MCPARCGQLENVFPQFFFIGGNHRNVLFTVRPYNFHL